MRLLITNDDGVEAQGIITLTRAVARWIEDAAPGEEREAIVVAPMVNHSGMSSAVGDVFSQPTIKYQRHHFEGAENIPTYALDATPALCTIIGALGSMGPRPELILSGINAGANIGRSVLHSGTIGAILTGAQLGLSGLAVSVQWGDTPQFDLAAEIAIDVLDQMAHAPERTLLNLNVPNKTRSELLGIRRGHISTAGIVKSAAPADGAPLGESGELPLRLGPATPELGDVSDEAYFDDGALLVAGYASLTPLRGVHEDTEPSMEAIIQRSLEAVELQLKVNR